MGGLVYHFWKIGISLILKELPLLLLNLNRNLGEAYKMNHLQLFHPEKVEFLNLMWNNFIFKGFAEIVPRQRD
jgi:hypothetical protein